jgi:O-antigen/teichoic acid export membrane protein
VKDRMFNTLIKRASYSSTGVLAARVSSAISGIVLARSVGAEQFGVYAALWALVNLHISFTEIGIRDGLIRDGARDPESLPFLVGNTLAVKVLIGICSLFAAYFLITLVTKNPKALPISTPLAIAGFSIVCMEPFYSLLYVKGKQKLVASFETGRGILFLIGFLLLAYFQSDIIVFAWFQGLLYITSLLIVCVVVIPSTSIAINLIKIKNQITSSFVFGIANVVFSIRTQLPILLLSHFGTEEEVGNFAIALRFIAIIFMIGAGAKNNAFLPLLFGLYQKNREKFYEVCDFMQKSFFAMGIFAAAALYVCSDAFIMILIGKEYYSAVGVLRILCWTIVLNYIVLPFDAALTTADRMWTKIKFEISAAILGLIVGVIAIGYFGLYGASITKLAIGVSLVLLYAPYAYRKNLFDRYGLKRIVIPTILLLSSSIVLTRIFPSANLQRPALFFVASLFILGPIAIKFSRNYSLISMIKK